MSATSSLPVRTTGFISFVFLSLVLMTATGCGGASRVQVNGNLVLPPKTKVLETDSVQITFVAEAKESTSPVVEVKNEEFSTKELVPGKYKVAVSVTPYAGEKGNEQRTLFFNDTINQQFNNANTPLSVEITSDAKQSYIIDVAKKSVTKK